MEEYSEVAVEQKMDFGIQFKRFLCTVLPLMAAVFIIIAVKVNPLFMIIKFLVCVGLIYLAYRMFMGFYIEWEYTFVINEIKFAKIMNKSRRKDLFTCQIKDTVLFAKNTNEDALRSVPKDAKTYRFLSNVSEEFYVWVTKDDKGKQICIWFEPNEVMIKGFSTLVRSKVFL